ncbi:membrane protein [Vibrio comitans NBRC 102076]|uniref:Membrane protein n=2 Tax=Vibrio comitans TaxID=413401 RepID=A0A4Y3IK00_9VIBR|nr:membrane protein [Vibrio comitans NBRC 102076]
MNHTEKLMANPEHKEQLDGLDKISVVSYRLGITLFALSLLSLFSAELLCVLELETAPVLREWSINFIAVSAALSAANIHVYDKKVRAIIAWSSWIGLALFIVLPSKEWLYIGFIFITFSGIALKESYCFKVKGLNLVPLLLILSVLVLWMKEPTILAALVGLSGLIYTVLAIEKWKMPLHFDIGNKANYEI